MIDLSSIAVAAWLGGAGGRGPPADFFKGAPKFKKGAKNLLKLHGSITFFPAPRGWSHGRSIQIHLIHIESLSWTNHFGSM